MHANPFCYYREQLTARRNVFPELKREALERVNAGESTASVAAKLGVSPTSVKNWIKRNNYQTIGGQGQQSAVDAMQYALEAEGYRHRKIPVRSMHRRG